MSSDLQPRRDRQVAVLLIFILCLALVLRLWGINFGLPYDFTPDELHEIVRALKLGAGEYSWTPGKGGLYFFLFVEYGLLYVVWWLTGIVDGPADFALRFIQDPSAFYLAGRTTVAIMGTATCYVMYVLGKRLYDIRVGIAAAILGATAYYHAMWSHYINVDIGMVLAVWASILAYVEYERRNRTRWLVLAGALAGIAFAFKFPGLVVVIPLSLAIATPLTKWSAPLKRIKEGLIIVIAMVITTAVVAPENVLGFGYVAGNFTSLLSDANEEVGSIDDTTKAEMDFDSAVHDVTVFTGPNYLAIILRDHNILLAILALIGSAIGVWKRNRWDLIWAVLIIVFLGVMTVADRPGEERYMLPVLPALWLLASRAAATLSGQSQRLMAAFCALIITVPLYTLIKQNYAWTLPDTRVLAKQWIETNVASDSKILMDGMRYRFIQSPPLLPNNATVSRRVGGAEDEERLSRGVSTNTLDLYAEAMSQLDGPKYDLYSTVWGIGVKDLSYYPQECFDYVIVSSTNSRRFRSDERAEKYPLSARFYRQISKHAQYTSVLSIHPSPWEIQGPSIDVYDVKSACE